MTQHTSKLITPIDFSLVQGGPLLQLFLRLRLARLPMELLARRIIVFSGLAWLPVLLLCIMSGNALGGSGVPFLLDIDAQVRCLVYIPLLLAAELIVHSRLGSVVRQFLEREIVAPKDHGKFQRAIDSAMKLRNSVTAEILLLALAVGVGHFVYQNYFALTVTSWMVAPSKEGVQLTAAGSWYLFVSLNIMRFLLCRWIFRLFIWCRFLWTVSRTVPLQLNALHPDRAAGLGFLANSAFAIAPVLLAQTTALAGNICGQILHEGAVLTDFKLEIVLWIAALVGIAFLPLLFFVGNLAQARRVGIEEYGIIASRYATQFRKKWIEGNAETYGTLLGSGDIQSLADLSNSFEATRATLVVPFGRNAVVRLAVLLSLPLLPLTLTMIPAEQLLERVIGVLL